MSNVAVLTWYAPDEPNPWRLAHMDAAGILVGEVRCPTFAALLVALGEEWAHVMPEPVLR